MLLVKFLEFIKIINSPRVVLVVFWLLFDVNVHFTIAARSPFPDLDTFSTDDYLGLDGILELTIHTETDLADIDYKPGHSLAQTLDVKENAIFELQTVPKLEMSSKPAYEPIVGQKDMTTKKDAQKITELSLLGTTKAPILGTTEVLVTSKEPSQETTKIPTHVTAKEPSHVTTTIPAQVTTQKLTQVTTNEPTYVTTKEPSQLTTKITANVSTKEPSHVTTKTPVHDVTKEPTEATTQIPVHVRTKEPTQVTTQIPVHVRTKKPTQVTTKIPAHGTTKEPSQVTTKISAKVTTQKLTHVTTSEPSHETTTATSHITTKLIPSSTMRITHQYIDTLNVETKINSALKYEQKEFFLRTDMVSWEEAREKCAAERKNIANIEREEDQSIVEKLIISGGVLESVNPYWVSKSDPATKETSRDALPRTGETQNPTTRPKNYPSETFSERGGFTQSQHCFQFSLLSKWTEEDCQSKSYYICQT